MCARRRSTLGVACGAGCCASPTAIASVMINPRLKNLRNIMPSFLQSCGFAAARFYACSRRIPLRLLNPVRDEDIRVASRFGIAIRCEDQFLAVGREHGEA